MRSAAHFVGRRPSMQKGKRCNDKGGDYQNGNSSKWRQRWAWGCKGWNTRGSAKERTRHGGKSKQKIPKEGNFKRGDTKIKRWNPRGSQGEHGGAKDVTRGCQREGVHKNQGKPRWARGREPREAIPREHFPTGGYQRWWDPPRYIKKGNAKGKPRWAGGCFVLKIKPEIGLHFSSMMIKC